MVRSSIFVSVHGVQMGVFLPWNLLSLGLCFEVFEPWLVYDLCLVPKPDVPKNNVDMSQIDSSILFLGYKKSQFRQNTIRITCAI